MTEPWGLRGGSEGRRSGSGTCSGIEAAGVAGDGGAPDEILAGRSLGRAGVRVQQV